VSRQVLLLAAGRYLRVYPLYRPILTVLPFAWWDTLGRAWGFV